jgi:isopenicillin N synthase-like dioxygenase
MTTDTNEIPIIDFDGFLNGSKEEQHEVAKKIGEACCKFGLFYLINHGVPLQLIKDTFTQQKRYFDLPVDVKMKLVKGQSIGEAVGYTPRRVDKNSTEGDYKEMFTIGSEISEDGPDVIEARHIYNKNRWPDLPGKYSFILKK